MRRYKVRAIVLTAVVFVFAVSVSPVRSQEQDKAQDAKAEKVEEVQPAKPADPKAATTTEALNIPVDELKVLLKPLTLEELRNEAAAWMLVLQKKAHEISEAEVTIKRENQAISQQQEGADTLVQAKLALEAAEQAQKGAAPVSPQYQELEKKGGDPKPYRQYTQAVMSIDVDTKDTRTYALTK